MAKTPTPKPRPDPVEAPAQTGPLAELKAAHARELEQLQLTFGERMRQVEARALAGERSFHEREERLTALIEQYVGEARRDREEMDRLRAQLTQQTGEAARNENERAVLAERAAQIQARLDALTRSMSRAAIARLEGERDAERKQTARLRREITAATQALDQLKADQAATGTRLEAALEETARLGAELADRQAHLARAEHERTRLGGALEETRRRAAADEAERAELARERAALDRELSAATARHGRTVAALSTEVVRLKQERRALAEAATRAAAAAEKVRETISFGLGQALIRAGKKPAELFALPGRVAELRRRSAERRRAPAPPPPAPPSEEDLRTGARQAIADGGAEALQAFVDQHALLVPAPALAAACTAVAREVRRDPALALIPGQQAARLDPRAFRRKWLAFLMQEAGHVAEAHDLLASVLAEGETLSSEEGERAARLECDYRELALGRSGAAAPPPIVPSATPHTAPIPIPPGVNTMTDQQKAQFENRLAEAAGEGEDAVERLVTRQGEGRSARFAAYCRMKGANALLERGQIDSALRATEAALALDRSPATLRAATSVYYQGVRLERAAELARELEAASPAPMAAPTRRFVDEVICRRQLELAAAAPPKARRWKPAPRRVLNLLSMSLPHTSVGYATRSHGLAKGIIAENWDLIACTRPGYPLDSSHYSGGESVPNEELVDGVHYRRLPKIRRNQMNEVEYLNACVGEYQRLIGQIKPEVVHAASNYVTALPAMIAARRKGVPFVYEVRGFWEITRSFRDDSFRQTPKYRFMRHGEDLLVREADALITITTPMKTELVRRGADPDRTVIAYNSVDPDRFTPGQRDNALAAELGLPDGVPVIGYVGSFVDYEGLDDLITAAGGLKVAGAPFRLLLVGDGAVGAALRRQIEGLGLQDRVIMPGRVPHDQVERYYSLIDIAPFPRKTHAVSELVSPIKPFEAMALAKAVVVSDTAALAEIVDHGRTGLTFHKGDPAALQEALARLLGDMTEAARMGEAARAWVRRSRTWRTAALACVSAYEIAAGSGRKTA